MLTLLLAVSKTQAVPTQFSDAITVFSSCLSGKVCLGLNRCLKTHGNRIWFEISLYQRNACKLSFYHLHNCINVNFIKDQWFSSSLTKLQMKSI